MNVQEDTRNRPQNGPEGYLAFGLSVCKDLLTLDLV